MKDQCWNEDVIISKAYHGNTIVIMNKLDYREKTDTILTDTTFKI